jgi:D-serine dehydratase
MVQDVTEISSSIKRSADISDVEALKEKLEANPQALPLKTMLSNMQNKINDLNDAMDKIRRNPNLPAEDKVKRINALRDQKNKLAEQAVTIGKQFGM